MIDLDHLDRVEQVSQRIRKRKKFIQLSSRYVPGEGDNPQAFIIGEAPGADEDIKRRPFVGRAGGVMRQLMSLANLYAHPQDLRLLFKSHEDVAPNCWLTNAVKFRPPHNRNPKPEELMAFRRCLREEWIAVGCPRLIIPVGGIALWAVLGKRVSILRAAGKCHWYTSRLTGKGHPTLAIWPMVHPSFVIRQQSEPLQELIEQDWEKLKEWRDAN